MDVCAHTLLKFLAPAAESVGVRRLSENPTYVVTAIMAVALIGAILLLRGGSSHPSDAASAGRAFAADEARARAQDELTTKQFAAQDAKLERRAATPDTRVSRQYQRLAAADQANGDPQVAKAPQPGTSPHQPGDPEAHQRGHGGDHVTQGQQGGPTPPISRPQPGGRNAFCGDLGTCPLTSPRAHQFAVTYARHQRLNATDGSGVSTCTRQGPAEVACDFYVDIHDSTHCHYTSTVTVIQPTYQHALQYKDPGGTCE
jgi:hypothetical protein